MRVKMLKEAKGSEDGYTVSDFYADQEYDLGESLAQAFLNMGVAEVVREVQVMRDIEPKEAPRKGRKRR